MPQDWANGLLHERGGVVYNVSEELDSLRTLAATIQAALNAPSGTKILFQQTAAPTGWTKDTTHNNKALRVVSGTVGSGGTTAFTTVFGSRTLAQSNLPNVTLTVTGTVSSTTTLTNATGVVRNGGTGGQAVAGSVFRTSDITASTTSTFSNGATASINGGVAQTALDFAVQYVDIIIATKD